MRPEVEALQKRTRAFANAVIQLCDKLPRSRAASKISDQLLDSSSSTDSNYRAACRARSRREFIAVLGKVIEECDESLGWLEMLVENRCGPVDETKALAKEATNLWQSSCNPARPPNEITKTSWRETARYANENHACRPITPSRSARGSDNRQAISIRQCNRHSAIPVGIRQSRSAIPHSHSSIANRKIGTRHSAIANAP